MRVLELFGGIGSVGKVASAMGYEVISVGRDMHATHQGDNGLRLQAISS